MGKPDRTFRTCKMHSSDSLHVSAFGTLTRERRRSIGKGMLVRDFCNEGQQFRRPSHLHRKFSATLLYEDQGRARNLYLLPDRLLIYDSSGIGAVPYTDLQAQSGKTRFIETEQVPADSAQVGTTWRYVAVNGGPDRRFNNNRQLPIMLYGELKLSSGSGLNEQFQCSVPEAVAELSSAILPLASHSESDKIAVSFASSSQRQAFTRAGYGCRL